MKEVILAAGHGSRLWPTSTPEVPKQFQPLVGGRSLLQNTYESHLQSADEHDIYVLTLGGMEHLVAHQLPSMPEKNILAVPERRNTLPHTLFAINSIVDSDEEPVMIAGVDNVTTNPAGFNNALHRLIADGSDPKRNRNITLLGERAIIPDPTLGYIEADEKGDVQRFHEKPEKSVLEEMMKTRDLYDFSFIFTLSKLALRVALRDIEDTDLSEKSLALLDASPAQRIDNFLAMPVADISTTVFQRAQNLRICAGELGIVDVGKYAALREINAPDEEGNVILGRNVIQEGCKDSVIINRTGSPMVILGMTESVIVQTAAGTLVSPLDQVNAIGDIYKNRIYKK